MIRIIQCLCGRARHYIVGIAYELGMPAEGADGRPIMLTPETAPAWFRVVVIEGLFALGGINRACGICGRTSDQWIYEDGPTKFATIAEAAPEIARLQRENLRSREVINSLKAQARNN